MAGVGMVLESKVVVGLDFGTTFSGFAFALRADPDNVYTFYDWPMQAEAGGLPYCKTQTSLLYARAPDGDSLDPFQLREWGWPASVQYKSASTASARDAALDTHLSQRMDVLSLSEGSKNPRASKPSHSDSSKALHYVSHFKLHLATSRASTVNNYSFEWITFPPGLTARRAIADYLAQISKFVLNEVRNRFGAHISLDDIEWCLTVPAIWDEQAKKAMRECSEVAGLVRGPLSEGMGSPHPLKLISEPEAASVYCQQKLVDQSWNKGDKFLVVDCGGGTVDLVLHEKLGSSPSLAVREVQGSSGGLYGGSCVDKEFLRFLRLKISCFMRFERRYPAIVLAFLQDWEKIKRAYTGECWRDLCLELPPKLAAMWEDEFDLPNGGFHDEIVLTDSDMRSIFDPVVNCILLLILERGLADLQAIMVVGGFSESEYLMKRIRDTFSWRVGAIVSPPSPGSAVCCGAVALGILSNTVVSRISNKSYGIRIAIPFEHGVHSESSKFEGDHGIIHCVDGFRKYVTKGDEVRFDDCVKHIHRPVERSQTIIGIELYSSDRENVRYITDPGVKKEGCFAMECPRELPLGLWPRVEVSMFFGRSDIQVTAIGKNFDSEEIAMEPVTFERESIF